MIVQAIYSISNLKKELDGIDLEKARIYNHLLIFDENIPDAKNLKSFIGQAPVLYLIKVHKDSLEELKPFDKIHRGENRMDVCKVLNIEKTKGILCRFHEPFQISEFDSLDAQRKHFTVEIITISDRVYNKIYADKSGPAIAQRIRHFFEQTGFSFSLEQKLIPQNKHKLAETIEICKNNKTDLIITTGGTGIGPNDFTSETIEPMLEKTIPGLMEMIRLKYGNEKPTALLSRSIAGVIGRSLVYALPGGENSVNQYLDEIIKTLEHQFYTIHGIDIY